MKQDHKWWLVSTGAALVASSLTKSLIERSYLQVTGRRPPQNPASPRVQWRTAFGWAVAAGVLVSLSELLAERGAAAGWRRVTGKYPRSLVRKKT
jgi:hypothetical protein